MPKQNVGVELYYDGTWNDIAAAGDVFADTPIVIKRGQSDEGSAFRPCTIACSLNNDDDRYRTSNPVSPLYGKAGRNTPIRVKVGGTVRGTAEASSWTCDQTQDFRAAPPRGAAWTDVDAGGLLRRIGQWTEPLRSPFTQFNIDRTSTVGYWAAEDDRGAPLLASATPGALTVRSTGVEYQSQNRFAGSGPLMDLPTDVRTSLAGLFVPGPAVSTAGWQFSWTARYGSIGTAGSFLGGPYIDLANGGTVQIAYLDGTDVVMLASDGSGNTVINLTFADALTDTDWSKWNCFIVRATYSAGTTTISFYWMTEDSPVFAGPYTGTYAGDTSSLEGWRDGVAGGLLPAAWTVGHYHGTSGTTDNFLSINRVNAFKGYANETAADRFDRLCALKGISNTIIGTAADSYPMGPQAVDTFPNQLKEIVDTEDALCFDDIDAVGLVLLLRKARYRQTPALTLAPTDMPALPHEVTDDLDTHNIVTASQRNGGDFTAEDSTSSMGSQPPPAGVGEARQTVNLNVSDAVTDLQQQAWWWLKRGTVALPRFPEVTIDLNSVPGRAILAAVEAVDVGSVIQISSLREYTIRLHVLGWTETIGTHTRLITFTCAPDQQLVVGQWDATDSRWDAKTSLTDSATTSTQTTLALRTLDVNDTWLPLGGYQLLLGGELVTVTAMTAPSLVFGGYNQTATVTRSVNGVVKSHASGTPVHVSTPGRWAL